MALNKRLFIGGADDCTTDTADIFGDSKGIALYSLDSDASDTGGSKDGTPTNITFGVGGKINTSARFNGTDSYISLPNNLVNSVSGQLFSVCFWFNSDDITRYAGTFSAYDYDGNNHGWTIFTGYSSSKLRFLSYAPSLATMDISGATTLSSNTWYHAAVTYDGTGGTCKLYVNGSLDGSGSTTGSRSYITNHTYYLGANNNGAGGVEGFYKGELDQVRVFSKALSATEVGTIYAETACTYTATTTDNAYPTTNLAYYKLDNSAEDEKGSYDGTESNIEYTFGRFGQAAKFNGSSSYIALPNGSMQITTLTISAWINPSSLASGGANMILETYGYSGGSKGWLFRVSSSKLDFLGYATDPANTQITSSETIPLNTWTHVAVVFVANTTGKLYINGSEATYTSQTVGTPTFFPSENTTLGALRYGGGGGQDLFAGQIDQVRVFSSALSDSQITELYNEKPETDTSNFKAITYKGAAATQYISNLGIDLETNGGLVWTKSRSQAYNHMLYDSVRGATNYLESNSTAVNQTHANSLMSFEANGFFLGTNDNSNYTDGGDGVSWVWKGGGDAVLNEVGDIDSQVSANTAAGFSIVKYTAPSDGGVYTNTVGHGLSSAPEIIIQKRTNLAADWYVLTSLIDGSNDYLVLNSTAAKGDNTQNFVVTSSTFTDWGWNGSTLINYCFHSVAGYSKVSTYIGATSGVTVNVGFAPSFVLIKNTTQTDYWGIFDNKRPSGTGNRSYIYPNSADDEDVYSGSLSGVTLTSTGFAIDNTNSNMVNENGETYLYMAFK